ncbi:MAG: hypothetical protein ACI39E_07955 [Acutalibacteraceae bacterium]
MKMAKKVLSVILCLAMLAGFSMMGMAVSADEAKESVEGIRWFPADMERNNGFDDMWEVEAGDNMYQRFNEAESNPDALDAYLSTEYDANGALTLKRTGADGGDMYWPRIRTLYLENMPAIDLSTANTLYYDFTASENWMIDLQFGDGLELKLGKAICAAAGTATLGNTDEDGVAGTYKGSLNLVDTIAAIAADSADPHSTQMSALQKMNKTFVPQVAIFVVGTTEASVTMNSLFISSAEDTNGEKCDLMDMGLVYGDDYYELGAADGDADADADADADVDADADADADTDATKATTTTKANASAGGMDMTTIIIIVVVAVVVIAAIVVVVVVMSKKKKDGAQQ